MQEQWSLLDAGVPAGRRGFLQTSATLATGVALSDLFGQFLGRVAKGDVVRKLGWGPLRPVKDGATGLELLSLPEGFRYVTFGWTGDPLDNGAVTPGIHDGMAVIAVNGPLVTLCRNHEVDLNRRPFTPMSAAYDPVSSGGCVNLQFDTTQARLVRAWGAISGTLKNCAGGPTPWGTWLTCEETVTSTGELHEPEVRDQSFSTRDHGYIFEVPASGTAKPVPLKAMGRFVHEAVAVDPETGIVYETEDRKTSGFYRYIPSVRGRLVEGGRLEMMRVRGISDLRKRVPKERTFPVDWVAIDDVDRPHAPNSTDTLGVYTQGKDKGATTFARLEGCWYHGGCVYFNATSGGDVEAGQVWEYQPKTETLRLVFESPDKRVLESPDNLCVSPGGGLVICEDGDLVPQRLHGLTKGGQLFAIAALNAVLKGEKNGFRGDFRNSEWAGSCFSPDGQWLFANIQSPGFTVAITGPWKDGGM